MRGQSRAARCRSRREEERAPKAEWATLEEFARLKIQGWIQDLLNEEITELLGREKSVRREPVDAPPGYRNGHGKPRRLSMSCGTITVRRPRVRELAERFESRVLPLFVKRTAQVADLLPQLYLHGLAQGDFELALRGLLGDEAPLSAKTIERLREKWTQEFAAWSQRRLDDLAVVYVWADGLYVKAGLEDERAALLVLIGALRDGTKVVLAVESGQRESTASWARVLRSLRERGLQPWKATVADGHLGLSGALREVGFTAGEELRCWNHKLTNVIDQLPKKVWPEARQLLREIPYAATQAAGETLRARFVERYGKLYPKAAETLCRDWDRMVAFYRFPKEHWIHLRTSNVVESPFAAVRLRTEAAKRYKRVANAEALIWKILMVAEQKFRRLNAPHLLDCVYGGTKFVDGVVTENVKRNLAA